jgi:hypothetical protein
MPEALFIGGGTGGGKTTLARALATAHGLRVLHVDAFWYAYEERAGETPPPPDVQWLEWTPETQAADFERISRLMLGYVLDDLPALPDQPAVIVEGPQIVPDLLPGGARAVFLTASPEFQRAVLLPRPMPSSDPARALEARLVKDRIYADRVAAAARERGFMVVDVDGVRPPDEIRSEVERRFADFLQASEPRDLAAVRRWENANVARNLRGWFASSSGPRDEPTYPFCCECGVPGCAERVDLAVSVFDRTGPVLAPGHER